MQIGMIFERKRKKKGSVTHKKPAAFEDCTAMCVIPLYDNN